MQFKTFVCLSETIKMLKSYIHISNCHIYVLITVYLAKLQYIYIQLSKCLCRKFQYLYPNAVFRIRFMEKVSMYILIFEVFSSCNRTRDDSHSPNTIICYIYRNYAPRWL